MAPHENLDTEILGLLKLDTISRLSAMELDDADRFGSLPADLVSHIFSFLDTKEVIQLGLVQRQWRDVWRRIPFLSFNNLNEPRRLLEFIEMVLLIRKGTPIQKLYIASDRNVSAFDICKLLKAADIIGSVTPSQFQEIHLSGISEVSPHFLTLLSRAFKVVRLSSAGFVKDKGHRMLNIDSEHIENLVFSACEPYRSFTEMNINAPRLKYLEIRDSKPTVRKGYCHIKIGAPNISGIKFAGFMFRDYSLPKMHSLVDACIDTNHTFEDNYKALEKCLVHLLDGVSTTKSLTISTYAFQACSKLQETMEALPISFTNLKHLRLTGLYNKGHIKALANFLVKCCYIEKLVLEISQEKEHPEDMLEADWGQELAVERSFDKLESVEIRRLEGCLNEIQLLNFLLKNAPELRKITLIKGEPLRNNQVKMDIFLHCLQSLMFDHADEEWDIR